MKNNPKLIIEDSILTIILSGNKVSKCINSVPFIVDYDIEDEYVIGIENVNFFTDTGGKSVALDGFNDEFDGLLWDISYDPSCDAVAIDFSQKDSKSGFVKHISGDVFLDESDAIIGVEINLLNDSS